LKLQDVDSGHGSAFVWEKGRRTKDRAGGVAGFGDSDKLMSDGIDD
jgi:hypothetical protein